MRSRQLKQYKSARQTLSLPGARFVAPAVFLLFNYHNFSATLRSDRNQGLDAEKIENPRGIAGQRDNAEKQTRKLGERATGVIVKSNLAGLSPLSSKTTVRLKVRTPV